MTRTDQPRTRVWSSIESARFWAYWSSRKASHTKYFSYQVGSGIVRFAELAGVLKGTVLDYGCGPGFLTTHLLDRRVSVQAVDFCPEAVNAANDKFTGRPGWRGAVVADSLPTALPADHFDLVLCVETLEHVAEEHLSPLLDELQRVCRPGGFVLVSTPCSEDLGSHFTYCPFCNSEFHARQHQRSFTPQAMRQLLEKHGFCIAFCQGVQFARFRREFALGPLRRASPVEFVDWFRYRVLRLWDWLRPRPFPYGRGFQRLLEGGPHLCALVEKPASE